MHSCTLGRLALLVSSRLSFFLSCTEPPSPHFQWTIPGTCDTLTVIFSMLDAPVAFFGSSLAHRQQLMREFSLSRFLLSLASLILRLVFCTAERGGLVATKAWMRQTEIPLIHFFVTSSIKQCPFIERCARSGDVFIAVLNSMSRLRAIGMPIICENDFLSLLERMPLQAPTQAQPQPPTQTQPLPRSKPDEPLIPAQPTLVSANLTAKAKKRKRNVRFSEEPPIFHAPPDMDNKPSAPTPPKKRRQSHDDDPDSPLPVVVEKPRRAATPAYALDDAVKVEEPVFSVHADDSGYGNISSKAEEEEVQQLLSPASSSAVIPAHGSIESLSDSHGLSFDSPEEHQDQNHPPAQIFSPSNPPTYFSDNDWAERPTSLRSPIKLQSKNKRPAEFDLDQSPNTERLYKLPKIEIEVPTPSLSHRRRW